MAVELRCPECRAKLRLPVAPEPDSEIECPKCAHVFPTDDNLVHAGAADEQGAARKKKSRDDEGGGDERPAKKEKKAATATKTADKPKSPKKRKLKKRKTNPWVIVMAVVGGLMVLGCIVGGLIWFFNRKSASMEMMMYLPDDCDEVSGVNLGHMQKYPEFYKACESTFANTGFKKAGDVFSKALGQDMADTVEYVVQGTGKTGGSASGTPVEATVLRTKAEYDTSLLSKLPGAKEYSQDGVKYYTVNDIPELGYPGLRVFAPTNRLVVFCRGDMPEKTFRAMLNGNKDNPDGTAYKRSGQLGKQVIRGTAWKFMLYGRSIAKLAPPVQQKGEGGAAGGAENEEDMLKKEIADVLSSAQGCGFKASVGSREVRGEWVVWYKDSETASNMAKKWKEKDWVNDEEKEPPKWWKSIASKSGGGKTAPNVIRDGLGFKSSGETFTVRTSMETKLLSPSSLVSAFAPSQQQNSGPSFPGGPGGQRPGGGGDRPRRRRFLPTRRPSGVRGQETGGRRQETQESASLSPVPCPLSPGR
jgi:hypothetical protein